MRICHNAPKILISPGICFALAFALLLIQFKWVAAWVVAVTFHELGHYTAIKLCSGSVYVVNIGFCGAVMYVDIPSTKAELICAISGPICGALLILLGRWLPRLAVCAFVQTAYNILPISGLDGWRVLRCVVGELFSEMVSERIMFTVEWAVLFGIFALCVIVAVQFHWGMVMVVGAVVLAVKAVSVKIPCKQRKQIVQ